jgi:hypothetical protein
MSAETLERAARSSGLEWLARTGFAARGLIYSIIGVLAFELALGTGGKKADQQGALAALAGQPFGKVLLVAVTIGLAGYALWRLLHALLGHGPEKSDDAVDRLTALASAFVYAGLCAIGGSILLGSGGGGSGNAQRTTAGVFGWPGGRWLVALAGAVLIGVALYQGYRALSKDFLEDSKAEEAGPLLRKWIVWIAVFGYLARMVAFGLVGAFLLKAAVEFDPNKAESLDGALAALSHTPYGPVTLGIVAVGFIAFGVYSLTDARFRRL